MKTTVIVRLLGWLLLVGVLTFLFDWTYPYQGRPGIAATALIGGVLAGLYVLSGSLLLPVVLHVLADLRALLIPQPAEPAIDPTIHRDRERSFFTEKHP